MGEKAVTKCLILAGRLKSVNPELKKEAIDSAFVICADSGYKAAESLDVIPDLIVGDFDSAPRPNYKGEIITLPVKKDDTDLHFAAKEGIKRGFTEFVLSGVTGGRLDHTLAAIATLNFLFSNGCKAEISDKNCKIYLTDRDVTLHNPHNNCYLSVFPFGERAKGVSVRGAEYNLEDSLLTSDFPIGVSNHFKEDAVNISVKKGKLIIMLVKE